MEIPPGFDAGDPSGHDPAELRQVYAPPVCHGRVHVWATDDPTLGESCVCGKARLEPPGARRG